MITPSKKGGGNEQMHLRRRPFRWPCRGVEAIHAASPNAACPGLLRKPLDAAIGQLLAPYRPGGCQGDSKQYNRQQTIQLMAVLMAIAMQLYYTVRIARWRRSRAFIKATERRHRASTCSNSINRSLQCCDLADV
jgi:hypothetical protein